MKRSILTFSIVVFSLFAIGQEETPLSITVKSDLPGVPDAVLSVRPDTRALEIMPIKMGKHAPKPVTQQLPMGNERLAANGCDTITHITANDTVLTTWNFGTLGWLGGTFTYTNKTPKWAEYFVNTFPANTWIQNVEMTFTMAGYSSPTKTFKMTVWDNNGTAGAPGTVWASYNIPYKTISDWINQFNGAVRVTVSFNSPISINGNPTFFVGTECDTVTPDTLATAFTSNIYNLPSRTNTVWTNVAGTWNEVKNIFVQPPSNNPIWVNGFTGVGVTQFPISSYPSPVTDTICAESTINYMANDTANVASYQWILNGATPSNTTIKSPPAVYNTPGIYSYQYRAYNQCGMYNSWLGQITVDTLPPVVIGSSVTTLCPGQTVSLTATGGVSYNWNGGGITGNSGPTQVDVVNATTEYKVTGTGTNGCTKTDSVTVTIPSTVTAATQHNPTTNICMNTPIVFNAGTSTGATNYMWYLPGSSLPTSTLVGPTASYSTPGPKTISLVAYNQCFTDSTSFSLTVDSCSPAGVVQNAGEAVTLSTDGYGIVINAHGVNTSANLQLINMHGQIVLNNEVNIVEGSRYYRFTSQPATGVYLIRVVTEDRMWSSKSLIK